MTTYKQVGNTRVAMTAEEETAFLASMPSAADLLAKERETMVCSLIQAKAALDAAGLLTQADVAVAAAGGLTALAWTSANELERNSATVAALQAAMSLSDTAVDDLFRAAMVIKL